MLEQEAQVLEEISEKLLTELAEKPKYTQNMTYLHLCAYETIDIFLRTNTTKRVDEFYFNKRVTPSYWKLINYTSQGGVIVENMHDIPYMRSHLLGPETTAFMTRVCVAVRNILPMHVACGVQILAAANKEAVAVAQASNLNFIRAEGFVFGHIADEGYIESCAGSLLRYRRQLGADHILILTDIKKKHSSHSITSDVSIEETAESAQFFGSDGIILTGLATGKEANQSELESIKKIVKIPVVIGSGVTDNNLHKFTTADAFIIGSHFKKDGRWNNALDEERIRKFMEKYYKFFPKCENDTTIQ